MPWSIQKRDGQYCVVKEGDDSPVPGGCHASRADAIKHQRALYANESRVAAIYEQLDRVEEQAVVEQAAAQVVRLVVEQPEPQSQIALAAALERVADAVQAGERTTEALMAALTAAGGTPPTIVVEPTPISIEVNPTPVNVEVQAPNVQVEPQIVLPTERKEVVFRRDPAGRITGAVVEEG